MNYTIIYYVDNKGNTPFYKWFESLNKKDKKASAIIALRLDRLEEGLLGDFKSIGHGLLELRINFGPGYRIYLANIDKNRYVIFNAGSKSTQKTDIKKAQQYLLDYETKKTPTFKLH